MDWANLKADEDYIIGKHFTPGRSGLRVDKVVIHNTDGNLTGRQCVDNVWSTRPASAHYCVASDGSVCQTVWDRDTAWHCGDFGQNCRSIGIEHANSSGSGSDLTEACLDAGAHLVAAVCLRYGLGRPEWLGNVFGHSDISPTDCPGPLREGHSQHDEYMRRAKEWYDRMAGGGPADAAQKAISAPTGAEGEDEMVCLFQPNDEGRMVYYDGHECHPLGHPDEMKAIQEVYRLCHGGREIPCFKLGTKAAPWATRFMDAASRKGA